MFGGRSHRVSFPAFVQSPKRVLFLREQRRQKSIFFSAGNNIKYYRSVAAQSNTTFTRLSVTDTKYLVMADNSEGIPRLIAFDLDATLW